MYPTPTPISISTEVVQQGNIQFVNGLAAAIMDFGVVVLIVIGFVWLVGKIRSRVKKMF